MCQALLIMAPECFDHWATWASYRVPAVMIYLTKHITFWQLSHCRLSGNKVGGKWSKQVVKEIWEKNASHVVPLLSIQWSHLLCILQQRPQCFLIGQMALNPQNCPFHGGSRFFWLMHVSPPPLKPHGSAVFAGLTFAAVSNSFAWLYCCQPIISALKTTLVLT